MAHSRVSEQVAAKMDDWAAEVVAQLRASHPNASRDEAEVAARRRFEEARQHLGYLAESVAYGTPALFADYVAWANEWMIARGAPGNRLAQELGQLLRVVEADCPDLGRQVGPILAIGLERLNAHERAMCAGAGSPLTERARAYLDFLLAGQRQKASRLVEQAVADGESLRTIYIEVFQAAQREIGRLWALNQITVAQEHFCTAATQLIMSMLYPQVLAAGRRDRRAVATSVSGDLHEIGVRMVSDFLELEGFDTLYLGANTPNEDILATLKAHHADILAVSVTITSHVHRVAALITELRARPALAHVRVMVGGYPFNVAPTLWQEVGANGFALDAPGAAKLALQLVGA